ncbi:anti-sigma factor [Maribacter halichondriae]|uniref:anti-sigma factor n=1 Tax=Maribacter halichondriae TaxID=2980554 RepID=UPI00235935E7|nr:anti-sigma factor [Maribacter sp. Hal144]
MDRKQILEEGLLELYLLGELTPGDEAKIVDVLKSDADLRRIFGELESDFEHMALENGMEPPSSVREALEKEVSSPKVPVKTLSLPTEVKAKAPSKIRFLVAASLAALFALSSLWLYNNWQTADKNVRALEERSLDMEERLTTIEKNYNDTSNKLQKINDPNIVPLLLVGNEKLPEGRATAYVNHTTKEVFLNTKGLPAVENDKTYQLWADVDGVMIDMGIVPTNQELIAMQYIDNAESLNITIEPAGGSDHPTVENLVSNVYL